MTLRPPLISIVIPVYNAEPYIEKCLQAAAEQSYPNLEIIAINDGSTDKSLELLKGINLANLRVFSHSNRGQSATINFGVSQAQGDFIKIVDADDWINRDHVQAQFDSVRDFPKAVSACGWGYFSEVPETTKSREELANRDYENPLEWIVDSLTLDEGMMGGWKWLIPRDVWQDSGGYDARLSLNNDFHFSISTLLASSGVRFAPTAVYAYRKSSTVSLSRNYTRKAMESAYLTTKLGCDLLLSRENSPRIRSLCATRFKRWAYDFYPAHPDLCEQAERNCRDLGGSSLSFPGGLLGKTLANAIGWKIVRKLQRVASLLGWSKLRAIRNRCLPN